jgi:predicted glycoside hydrolase/deacetylase ChbG (UPF0249 family)
MASGCEGLCLMQVGAARRGIVRATSVLVNGASAHCGIPYAVSAGLIVGLHFNITEGTPVAAVSDVASLVAAETGCFRGKFGFRDAFAAGKIDLGHVKTELQAQLARYTALHPQNQFPLYIDGHQHVHVIPGVFETIAAATAEHATLRIRLPALSPSEHLERTAADKLAFYKTIWHDSIACKDLMHRWPHLRTVDEFFGYSVSGLNASVTAYVEALQATAARGVSLEIMCHPGSVLPSKAHDGELERSFCAACKATSGCGSGPDDFSSDPGRLTEISVLCDPSVLAAAMTAGLCGLHADKADATGV